MIKQFCLFFILLTAKNMLAAVTLDPPAFLPQSSNWQMKKEKKVNKNFDVTFLERTKEGNPRGKTCNQGTGEYYKRWEKMIVDLGPVTSHHEKDKIFQSFQQKFGVPVFFRWGKKKSYPKIFPSCYTEEAREGSFMGETWVIKTKKKSWKYFAKNNRWSWVEFPEEIPLMKAFVLKNNGKILSYHIPYKEKPLVTHKQNNELVFFRDGGDYSKNTSSFFYRLMIHPSGRWRVSTQSGRAKNYQELEKSRIPCPQKLVDIWENKLNKDGPKKEDSYYCQKFSQGDIIIQHI